MSSSLEIFKISLNNISTCEGLICVEFLKIIELGSPVWLILNFKTSGYLNVSSFCFCCAITDPKTKKHMAKVAEYNFIVKLLVTY